MVVLVVEDDPLFRSTVKAMLHREGFRTIEAGDGMDGLQILLENGGSLDLLLTDIVMPRMDGLALAQATRELHPNLPILLMTGHTESLEDSASGYAVLRKPFFRQALIDAVRGLLSPKILEPQSPALSGKLNQLDPSRLERQQRRRAEAQKAKDRYDECSRYFREVWAEQQQGLIPAPDGSMALRQAQMAESAALREYVRVLRELSTKPAAD